MHGCEVVFGSSPHGGGSGVDVIYPIDYGIYPMAHRRALFFLSLTHVIHGALFFTFQALMTALPVPDAPGFPLYDYEYMRYPAAGIWVGFMVVITGLAGLLATRSKIMHRMDTRHCYFVVILVLNLMSCIFVTVLLVLCALAIAGARANIDHLNEIVYRQPESQLANDTFIRAVYYRLAVRVLCLCGLLLGFSISDFILSVLSASMSCRMVCQCCLVVGLPPPPPHSLPAYHHSQIMNRCNSQYFAAGQHPPSGGGLYSNGIHQYAGPTAAATAAAGQQQNTSNLPIPTGYYPHNSATLQAQFALLPPPPSYSESVQNFLCLSSSASPTAAPVVAGTGPPPLPPPSVTLGAANATADVSILTVQPVSSSRTAAQQQRHTAASSPPRARRATSRATPTTISAHRSPQLTDGSSRQRPPATNVIMLSCSNRSTKSPVGNVDIGSRPLRRGRRRGTTTALLLSNASTTSPEDEQDVFPQCTAVATTATRAAASVSASSTPLMPRHNAYRNSLVSIRSFSSSPPPSSSPLKSAIDSPPIRILASSAETRTFSLSGGADALQSETTSDNTDKIPLLLTTANVKPDRKQPSGNQQQRSSDNNASSSPQHKVRRSASHRTEKTATDSSVTPKPAARRRNRAAAETNNSDEQQTRKGTSAELSARTVDDDTSGALTNNTSDRSNTDENINTGAHM